MSLTAGTMPAPPSRSSRVADSLKGRLRLSKTSSVEESVDSLNKCARTSLSFTGREVLRRHKLEHVTIFGEVHLRPPPMAEIGEPRSGDPGFLPSTQRAEPQAPPRGTSAGLNGKAFCDISNSLN